MTPDTGPTEAILVGRRSLEGLRNVRLVQDWIWLEKIGRWGLCLRLSVDSANPPLVAQETDWYVVVSPRYPWGEICFYPSKERGITATFPHQLHNADGPPVLPFRKGLVCEHTPFRSFGRRDQDIEPYSPEDRLAWHVSRAQEWISAASRGELHKPGEAYENPDFPIEGDLNVVFVEGREQFSRWNSFPEKYGTVEFRTFGPKHDHWAANRFLSADGKELFGSPWGHHIRSSSLERMGIWLRFQAPIVLDPWQAPTDWKELREVAKSQGFNLEERLRPATSLIRDGKPHLALLGFPIPGITGGPCTQMHWQALMLPLLASGEQVRDGFRKGELGYWMKDNQAGLAAGEPLNWKHSENWHQAELQSRGRLCDKIISVKILVIGAGALGSAVSELLIRGGVRNLWIVDGESFEGGNLVRHTLNIDDLGAEKAKAVAERLNRASPHANVIGWNVEFPNMTLEQAQSLEKIDLVIDCSASDEVLQAMKTFQWKMNPIWVSASLGLWAKRLFLFIVKGARFPHEAFASALRPWLLKELDESKGRTLPRAGIGCWHPLMPARADDIWLWAATTVRHLDLELEKVKTAHLAVYEQGSEQGAAEGTRLLAKTEITI